MSQNYLVFYARLSIRSRRCKTVMHPNSPSIPDACSRLLPRAMTIWQDYCWKKPAGWQVMLMG